MVSKKRKTLKLKYKWVIEAFFPELQRLSLGVCKREKKTGSPTGSARPQAETETWPGLFLIHTHRNSYGCVPKRNTPLERPQHLVHASREGLGRKGLAGRGWQEEAGWEEGLAPFLSLIETTSLMSKGNNLS